MQKHSCGKAILFGSYAKENEGKDSDIDIAIISLDFGHDYLEEAVMLKEISEDIDLDISPRPYPLEEYRNVNGVSSYMTKSSQKVNFLAYNQPLFGLV